VCNIAHFQKYWIPRSHAFQIENSLARLPRGPIGDPRATATTFSLDAANRYRVDTEKLQKQWQKSSPRDEKKIIRLKVCAGGRLIQSIFLIESGLLLSTPLLFSMENRILAFAFGFRLR
jgi:hypothetical protein